MINDADSGLQIITLENVSIIAYKNRIYVPHSLRQRTIEWYHHYLNHPGGDRLYKTIAKVCYWKGMASQCATFCRKCSDCQKFKSRKRKYGHVPPKNVGTLIPWDTVHVDLIGPYSLTTKQYQPDGSVQSKTLQLTCMTMLDPVTGWFEIAEIPSYIVDDIKNNDKEKKEEDKAIPTRLFGTP